MPGSFQSNASNGVPRVARTLPVVQSYAESDNAPFEYPYAIVGVTRDASGAPLGGCTLLLLRVADFSIAAIGVSDGSGNYNLGASPSVAHLLVAYLPGSPDVGGVSVDSLVGA